MYGNKKYKLFLVAIFLVLLGLSIKGQVHPDSLPARKRGEYAFVLYAGAGISFYSGDPATPAGLHTPIVDKISPVGSLRLMWHPDHLLRVGLETGWMRFYSYKVDNNAVSGRVDVRAIPIMLVFSMPVYKRISVFAGPGGFLIHSKLEYNGTVNSRTLSLGWMAAAAYYLPVDSRNGIAFEIKWMDAFETRDAAFTLQLQWRWKFMTW